MDTRSPLDGIFNIIGGGLPQGHDKPLKQAVYNAVALLLLFLCCAAGWALFLILEPFIKPLMWALLVGSVLHPLKRSLRDKFQDWFQTLETTHTPVVLGILLLPINIANNISEFIGDTLLRHIKLIVSLSFFIIFVPILYFYTPSLFIKIFWNLLWFLDLLLIYVLNITSFSYIFVGLIFYMSLVYCLWTPENNRVFHFAAIGVWLIVCLTIANQFGSYALPVFAAFQVVIMGGFFSEIYNIYEEKKEEGTEISIWNLLIAAFQGGLYSDDSIEECEKNSVINNEDDENKLKSEQVSSQGEKKSPDNICNEAVQEKLQNYEFQKSEKNDPLTLELFESSPKKHDTVMRANSDMGCKRLDALKQGIQFVSPINPRSAKTKDSLKYSKFHRSFSQSHVYPSSKIKPGLVYFGINSYRRKLVEHIEEERNGSTFYLYTLMWACAGMLFWKNVVLLPLLPLPILFYIVKHIGSYLRIWQYIYIHFCSIKITFQKWLHERHDALVPIPIRGLYKIIHKINSSIRNIVKDSIDTVSSCLVILGLIVFLFCASVFIIVQIYAEAIMLVQISSNIINQTVVHNPELRQLLPDTFDDTLDSILDNAYLYGREGISKAVKGLMTDVDSSKSDKIEKQVLELWDRVYQSWMTSNSPNGPTVTQEAVFSSWEAFVSDIKKSPEMFNINGLMEFGKQNIGTLMSLLESVWSIVKGNVNIVLGSIGAIMSVVLGGGTVVLNFILSLIVFLTTLFYLLNCSGDLYKPVEIMTNFSPSGNRLGLALESAINGVFAASFKMAVFYGLWTWFIHNLFGVRIVYLPSAFATILGAVPFLGTYWAGVPAVLDLWLAQDRGLAALLFAVFQFLPTSIVDTTIYKEIKGGHPYLTGLAIAGGVFCLGVEGAIIGPILLCGLYVAMDLSSNIFKESPSEETLKVHLSQIQS